MKPYKKVINGKDSKNYYVTYYINGKAIKKCTGSSTLVGAEKYIKEKIMPILACRDIEQIERTAKAQMITCNPATLSDGWELFLPSHRKKSIGEAQMKLKRNNWDDFITFIAEKHSNIKYLHELDYKVCSAYIVLLKATGRYIKIRSYKRGNQIIKTRVKATDVNLSNKSINEYLGNLKQVCEALIVEGYMERNPFTNIPRMSKEYNSRECFTEKELQDIYDNLTPLLKPVFAIGLNTGMRLGDICTLAWRDVDLDGGWIDTIMNKSQSNKRVKVPLPSYLVEYLESLPQTSEYVLPEIHKLYFQNSTKEGKGKSKPISNRFKIILDELDIVNQRKPEGKTYSTSIKGLHSLRHNFVWMQAKRGVPLAVLQDAVGHWDIGMTQVYAAHANDQSKKESIEMPNICGMPDKAKLTPKQASKETSNEAFQQDVLEMLTTSDIDTQKMEKLRRLLLS